MAKKFFGVNYDDCPGPITKTTLIELTGVTVTKANPAVATSAAHGLVDGDVVYCHGFTEMTELNGEYYAVNQVNVNTFQLANETGIVDSSGFGSAETTGGTVRELKDPQAVAKNVVVFYDDSVAKQKLVDALQRAKEVLIELQ